MKHILITLFILISAWSFSQELSNTQELTYFAQVKLSSLTDTEISNLNTSLGQNPNVNIYRFDTSSNGLLIVTNPIQSLTKDKVNLWLNDFVEQIECMQVGVQGMDKHFAFNTEFCNNFN